MLEEGQVDLACPKLEESQRLDPGGGTLLNVALCHERQGRLATAWAEWREGLAVARSDGREDRASLALEHATALEPRVPRVAFALDDAPAPDVVVTLDQRRLAAAAWSSHTAIDPGAHTLTVTRPGYEPFELRFEIAAGEAKRTITVPPLAKQRVPTLRDPGAPLWGEQRIAGVAMTGAGALGCVLGTVAGFVALAEADASDAACVGGCTREGVDAAAAAVVAADVSTAALLIGAPVLISGVVTWVSAPAPRAAVYALPLLGPSRVGVVVGGRF